MLRSQAIDTPRIGYIVGFIYLVYTTPLAIIFALYYLYNLMGWSCFVGMTVILVSMPLNSWISKRFTKVQERLMAARDKRVTLMNEVNLIGNGHGCLVGKLTVFHF